MDYTQSSNTSFLVLKVDVLNWSPNWVYGKIRVSSVKKVKTHFFLVKTEEKKVKYEYCISKYEDLNVN